MAEATADLMRWERGESATHHDYFPEQKQDLLYGEVRSQAAAELGDHREKQKGKRLLIMHGEAWGLWREASEKVRMKQLRPSPCNPVSGR